MPKRLTALLAVFGIAAATQATEFKIFGRITFDEPELQFTDNNRLVFFPYPSVSPDAKAPRPSLRVLNDVEETRKSLPLIVSGQNPYGGIGKACCFEPGVGSELFFHIAFGGEIKSSPDLWAAFCIFAPNDDLSQLRLSFWNGTKKANLYRNLEITPRKWNFVKIKLNGPGFFENGEIATSIGIRPAGQGARVCSVDNIAIWSGTDSEPPETVRDVKVELKNNVNIISWQPSKDNLFVVKYRIYRGSIPDFKPAPDNLIAETENPTFNDNSMMRTNDYYIILAEDCVGNLSAPSTPAKS